MMKKWMWLVVVCAVNPMAWAVMKEDFQSYNTGVLSTQGWVFSSGDGEVIIGTNGTKVLQPYNYGYVQGTHGTPGNYTYPTGISVSSAGKAYFAAQMRPGMVSPGYATQTEIGCRRHDGDYPLCTIGVNIADNPVPYDRKGRFCFSSAAYSSWQNSENVVMFDANNQGYTFDIAVNLNIVNSTTIYATLYYRNLSLGGDWVKSTVLDNVSFNNTYGIQNDARTYVYGYIRGEIDNFRMGTGHIAASPMKENFESYNPGILSTQGWSFTSGDGDIILGTNGTKVLQPYNGGYVQGTHGTPGNYTYPTGISVSSAGKAYFSAQMRPGMVSPGYAAPAEIGCRRYDGDYPLCTIGINEAANPVPYDRMGRFCFSSAAYSSMQNSENVVMFDANNQGYLFDIAVNLNIINSTTIYATLSYRNVTLGGDWIKSTVLDNVSFNNLYGIQNDARTYVFGYIRGEIDNFQMGMGQVGISAVKENFESYSTGILSTQGWTFSSGNGEVITGANGTKVVRPYNGGYMQGTHGTAGQYTYPTGIDVSRSGQAYFSCQMKPRMVGAGYATQTQIGSVRYDGDYPLCTIGVNEAANPVAGDRKGRFCFSSAAYSSLQNSENVVMFDATNQGYLFDIAVNLDIVNSSEIYATLYYRNLSLGGDWVKSSVLSNVPFDNTYGIQYDARTYVYGYVGGEIDNFQMGMGHIQGVAAGTEPAPANGTSGVDPHVILKWKNGVPATQVQVYFGTSYTSVANATTASAEYMGMYDSTTGFNVHNYNASGLTPGATYYWRVDAADPKLITRVWSFTVNGAILSLDTQQTEINTVNPVYTPIEQENYSFNGVRELFGYNPRFDPGVTSFDSNNKPYIITGSRGNNGNGGALVSGTVIQTLNNSGRWIGLSPYQSIKAAYPDWDGVWLPWDRNIVFDNDNDAYMIVKLPSLSKLLLLYSRDQCWTWTCYELPTTEAWIYGARLEARKGYNEIIGPPAIIGDTDYLGGDIELIVPTKSNGVLTIPSPTVIYYYNRGNQKTRGWLTPGHSGYGNVAVTKGNYTHIIWMTMEDLSGHTGQAPVYAATYNRTTHAVSSPVLVGYAATQDDHNGPVITMSSDGYLHVIIGAHGNNYLQYAKSPSSNSTAGTWTPVNIGNSPGYSYTAFLCDANDTLHLMSRWAGTDSEYKFYLVYLYKTSSGSWQNNTTLVDPNRMFYMVWYHELTMDRENRLYLRYAVQADQLDRGGNLNGPYVEFAAYQQKWPNEPLSWLDPAPPNPATQHFCTVRTHDPVLLIKDNQGQGASGWRVADTSDFFNRMFKDGFEKGEFTTAGWTKQNTYATVATAAKYSGTYGAKLAQATWIERRISTVGITGVHVKFKCTTYGLDSGEYLYAEWSTNGSTWNALYYDRPTSWLNLDYTCASGADNNSGFRIRFRTNANSTSEYGYVDDIEVTGTRF